MAELDLIELLSADHQNLAVVDPDSLVGAIAQHIAIERSLLHPAIEAYHSDAGAVLRSLRDTDQRLEERLAQLQDEPNSENRIAVGTALADHIDQQERLFPQLRESIPEETLQELAEEVSFAIGGSPTHAHPHLPDHGPLEEIAADLAAVADHVRDRVHKHDRDERPTGAGPGGPDAVLTDG
jgi:hypothetical protein